MRFNPFKESMILYASLASILFLLNSCYNVDSFRDADGMTQGFESEVDGVPLDWFGVMSDSPLCSDEHVVFSASAIEYNKGIKVAFADDRNFDRIIILEGEMEGRVLNVVPEVSARMSKSKWFDKGDNRNFEVMLIAKNGKPMQCEVIYFVDGPLFAGRKWYGQLK